MTCLSLLHAEPEILTVQEYLILPELRPQIAKTHVYFTRNRIHLVLVYLHLTHQMQFCKSHSIAKRHFCLSCPSEGSGAGGGALPLPGPGGRAQWWRLTLVPPMSLCLQDAGACCKA